MRPLKLILNKFGIPMEGLEFNMNMGTFTRPSHSCSIPLCALFLKHMPPVGRLPCDGALNQISTAVIGTSPQAGRLVCPALADWLEGLVSSV